MTFAITDYSKFQKQFYKLNQQANGHVHHFVFGIHTVIGFFGPKSAELHPTF